MENLDPAIKNSITNQAECLPQCMEATIFDRIKIENNILHEIGDQTGSKPTLAVPKPIDEIKIENEIISEGSVSDNIITHDINPSISNHSRNKTTKSKKILPGPPFECEACGHGLPTKNALYQHRIRKHSRKETYHQNSLTFKCCLCSKCFSVVSLLRRHLDTEHQNMGFVCEYCGHNLPTRNALCQHRIRKHRSTNMKHKNITSKLKYSQNTEVLNRHESLNSEFKRHHQSSRKRVITDHVIWFECDDCGHKLPTKNALCQHRLRKHRKNAKSFRCKYCEIVLTSNRK